MPFEQLLVEAGYDTEANHRHCREAPGVDSLIPAKKGRSARVVAATPLRQEMVRRLGKLNQQTTGQGRPSCLRLSLASQSSPFSTILPIAWRSIAAAAFGPG